VGSTQLKIKIPSRRVGITYSITYRVLVCASWHETSYHRKPAYAGKLEYIFSLPFDLLEVPTSSF